MTKTAVKEKIETSIAPESPTANLPAVHQEPRGAVALPAEPKVYPARIAKAIVSIAAEIGHIQKEGWNDFQRYKYTKWEDINEKLQPLLDKYGLIILQVEQSRSLLEQNDKGSVLAIVYDFIFINEHGESFPPIPWTGIARLRDQKGITDDKAATKCGSQAEKHFCVKQFKIRCDDAIEPERPTLAKKDARDLFFRLQRSLADAPDIDAIKQWAADNKGRIELLPVDFQEQLRLHYRFRIQDPEAPPPDPTDEAIERYSGPAANAVRAHQTEKVVWTEDGERPATADD